MNYRKGMELCCEEKVFNLTIYNQIKFGVNDDDGDDDD